MHCKGKFRYSFFLHLFYPRFSSMLHEQLERLQWKYFAFLSWTILRENRSLLEISPAPFIVLVNIVIVLAVFPLNSTSGENRRLLFRLTFLFMRTLLRRQHVSIFMSNWKLFVLERMKNKKKIILNDAEVLNSITKRQMPFIRFFGSIIEEIE